MLTRKQHHGINRLLNAKYSDVILNMDIFDKNDDPNIRITFQLDDNLSPYDKIEIVEKFGDYVCNVFRYFFDEIIYRKPTLNKDNNTVDINLFIIFN